MPDYAGVAVRSLLLLRHLLLRDNIGTEKEWKTAVM